MLDNRTQIENPNRRAPDPAHVHHLRPRDPRRSAQSRDPIRRLERRILHPKRAHIERQILLPPPRRRRALAPPEDQRRQHSHSVNVVDKEKARRIERHGRADVAHAPRRRGGRVARERGDVCAGDAPDTPSRVLHPAPGAGSLGSHVPIALSHADRAPTEMRLGPHEHVPRARGRGHRGAPTRLGH